MRVGHGYAPLRVPHGTPMGGYVARAGVSSGVLDELEVHCVSFAGLRLIVADVLCVNDDLAAAVREALADDDAWVCATHTHSGPDVGDGSTPPSWRRAIAASAVAAASAASAVEEECSGWLHTGVLRDVGSPRGDELAEPRVPLAVLTCVDADGVLRGVLAVVPVHPTVLPATSTLISGDLAAAIRTALQRELGAPWVMVATGAAGDISTRRTRREQTAAECRRLGDETARQIAALIRSGADRRECLWEAGGGAWSADRRMLALPARRRDPRELQTLRATLEDRHALELRRGATAAARTAETALQGIAVAQARRRTRAVELTLSAARLGRLALFGIGAEPFHSFAEQLRDGPSVLIGYANGQAGYLADEAAYSTAGYEVLSSPFRRDAGAAAVASLIDLLPEHRED